MNVRMRFLHYYDYRLAILFLRKYHFNADVSNSAMAIIFPNTDNPYPKEPKEDLALVISVSRYDKHSNLIDERTAPPIF